MKITVNLSVDELLDLLTTEIVDDNDGCTCIGYCECDCDDEDEDDNDDEEVKRYKFHYDEAYGDMKELVNFLNFLKEFSGDEPADE